MSLITPKFRASYPNVFKPELNQLSKKEEFSITALFPKAADLTALKNAAQEAIIKTWGEDKTKWPPNLRTPFRDQAERKKEGVLPAAHEEGAIFMKFKSKSKPGVVDESVQKIIDEAAFYPGCWAVASVNAYTYDQAGNKGVAFGLNNVQKVGDDEPLGGKTSPDMDFKPVAGATEGADATSMFT